MMIEMKNVEIELRCFIRRDGKERKRVGRSERRQEEEEMDRWVLFSFPSQK